jgi:hypothetical protein
MDLTAVHMATNDAGVESFPPDTGPREANTSIPIASSYFARLRLFRAP